MRSKYLMRIVAICWYAWRKTSMCVKRMRRKRKERKWKEKKVGVNKTTSTTKENKQVLPFLRQIRRRHCRSSTIRITPSKDSPRHYQKGKKPLPTQALKTTRTPRNEWEPLFSNFPHASDINPVPLDHFSSSRIPQHGFSGVPTCDTNGSWEAREHSSHMPKHLGIFLSGRNRLLFTSLRRRSFRPDIYDQPDSQTRDEKSIPLPPNVPREWSKSEHLHNRKCFPFEIPCPHEPLPCLSECTSHLKVPPYHVISINILEDGGW